MRCPMAAGRAHPMWLLVLPWATPWGSDPSVPGCPGTRVQAGGRGLWAQLGPSGVGLWGLLHMHEGGSAFKCAQQPACPRSFLGAVSRRKQGGAQAWLTSQGSAVLSLGDPHRARSKRDPVQPRGRYLKAHALNCNQHPRKGFDPHGLHHLWGGTVDRVM